VASTLVLNARNINGSYTSPSVQLPRAITGRVLVMVTMTDAVFYDNTKVIDHFDVYESDDGTNWRMLMGFGGWRGGTYTDPKTGQTETTRPGIGSHNLNLPEGKYVQLRISTPSTIRIGATLEYE
jgi:hypothetical protein